MIEELGKALVVMGNKIDSVNSALGAIAEGAAKLDEKTTIILGEVRDLKAPVQSTGPCPEVAAVDLRNRDRR